MFENYIREISRLSSIRAKDYTTKMNCQALGITNCVVCFSNSKGPCNGKLYYNYLSDLRYIEHHKSYILHFIQGYKMPRNISSFIELIEKYFPQYETYAKTIVLLK